MATGIECAGLVLGILLLLIEATKYYSQGLQSFLRSRKYVSILTQYRTDLLFEQTKFKTTWQRIIELVDDPDIQRDYPGINLEELSRNPYNCKLAGVELTKLLSLALAVPDRDDTVTNIEMALQEIRDLVQEMARGFLEFVDEPLQKDFLIMGNLGKKSPKKVLKMLKAEIKGHNVTRNEQLTRIHQRNQDLYNFVHGEYQRKIWAAVRSQRPKKIASIAATQTKLFNIIQRGMQALHTAMNESLESTGGPCCEASHRVALQLGVLDVICDPSRSNIRDNYRFRVSFAAEKGFCDLDVRMFGMPMLPLAVDISPTMCSDRPHTSHEVTSTNDSSVSLPSQRELSEKTRVHLTMGSMISTGIKTLFRSSKGLRSMDAGNCNDMPLHLSTHTHDLNRPYSSLASCSSSVHTITSSINSLAPLGTSRSRPVSCHSESHAQAIPRIVLCEPDDPLRHSGSTEKDELGCYPCRCTVPNPTPVTSLCSAVQITPSTDIAYTTNQSCIGILSSTSGLKFHVCPRQPLHLHSTNFKSLREIMSSHPTPSMGVKHKLAVLLASSVMQLHGTGWLKELWTSSDIYFQLAPSGKVHPAQLAQPSVQVLFNIRSKSDTKGQPDNATEPILFSNKTLFSLGIVLIELVNWKPFQVLQGQGTTVVELVDDLEQQVGETYRLAVQGCVQGFKRSRQKLEDDDFKKLVYEEIVLPLESVLKHFTQKNDLRELFKETA